MRSCIVIIADSDEMARTLNIYVRCSLGSDVESYHMTYGRSLLSGDLVKKTDLFILELLRRDNIGYRAEALFTAEIWLPRGKKILIVSGSAVSGKVNTSLYWDLDSPDLLSERLEKILLEPVPSVTELDGLKSVFQTYYRPAVDHHHKP